MHWLKRLFRGRLDPGEINSLGNRLRAAGDLKGAESHYREAIKRVPSHTGALYNLAQCLLQAGQRAEAQTLLERLIVLEPTDADALFHLGRLHQDRGATGDAVLALRRASDAAPGNLLFRTQYAMALAANGEVVEAIAAFTAVLAADPHFADAHYGLGNIHHLLEDPARAIEHYRSALEVDPDQAMYRVALLHEKQRVCDWSGLEQLIGLQVASIEAGRPLDPFLLVSLPCTRLQQRRSAERCAQAHEGLNAGQRAVRRGVRRPGRLRIGYLSADFSEHATAYLIAEVFELHDRERFEITAYSYGKDDRRPMRERLRRGVERFTDIGALSDQAAAERIAADGMDILVDLKGYTTHARTGILAARPAPVQVNYLGYPGTMGASFIDYLIADAFVVPREHEDGYSEALVRLPGSYQPNDRKRTIGPTPSRRELGLPEAAFVFASFNHPYKILPDVFGAWMRLMRAVPGSVLWLYDAVGVAAENLRREASRLDVSPERLVFAPRATLADHLGRLRAADLFLDTFPCTGHTTASDALWAGLPVVTRSGETFASRVAGSLLRAAGLPELVTDSPEAYEKLASRLAHSPDEFRALRERLEANRLSCELFDTPRYVRHLESAFERMAQIREAGERPRSFDIP